MWIEKERQNKLLLVWNCMFNCVRKISLLFLKNKREILKEDMRVTDLWYRLPGCWLSFLHVIPIMIIENYFWILILHSSCILETENLSSFIRLKIFQTIKYRYLEFFDTFLLSTESSEFYFLACTISRLIYEPHCTFQFEFNKMERKICYFDDLFDEIHFATILFAHIIFKLWFTRGFFGNFFVGYEYYEFWKRDAMVVKSPYKLYFLSCWLVCIVMRELYNIVNRLLFGSSVNLMHLSDCFELSEFRKVENMLK